MKNLSIGILNELYGSQLTEKQREIIRSYYDYDLSVSEIAEEHGISRQAAFDALRKGERTLLDCEKRMGILSDREKIKADLERALEAIDRGDCQTAKSVLSDALNQL